MKKQKIQKIKSVFVRSPAPPSGRGYMLTPEQQGVVTAALAGYNVRVLAVPGAGKTFTLERLAADLREAGKQVLCLTYSSRLKTEWR